MREIPIRSMRTQQHIDELAKFQPFHQYAVNGNLLRALVNLKHRLYSQERMNADEMRDWGNILFTQLQDVIPLPD